MRLDTEEAEPQRYQQHVDAEEQEGPEDGPRSRYSRVRSTVRLTRRVTVELSPYRLLLSAETRRVLFQQITLRPHQARGVVLPHLILQRVVSRRR